MNKNIIDNNCLEDAYITTDRSEKFIKIAKDLGEFIKTLPLSVEDNNKLVYMMIEQITTAEHDAFLQGCDLGIKLGKEFATDETDNTFNEGIQLGYELARENTKDREEKDGEEIEQHNHTKYTRS